MDSQGAQNTPESLVNCLILICPSIMNINEQLCLACKDKGDLKNRAGEQISVKTSICCLIQHPDFKMSTSPSGFNGLPLSLLLLH